MPPIVEWAIVEWSIVPGDAALLRVPGVPDIAEWSIPCIDELEAIPAMPAWFIPCMDE